VLLSGGLCEKANCQKTEAPSREYEKCWTYIGRFLWQFGIIESFVNEIFVELYDLENVAFPFVGLIDTRKKLTLIDEGLKEKGSVDHKRLIERVHDLHNLRNVLAHSNFFEASEGMHVDHINHQGKRWGGLGDKKREEEGNYLGFAELDRRTV